MFDKFNPSKYVLSKDKSTYQDEYGVLRKHANYYLDRLGLPLFNSKVRSRDLREMSFIGDTLVRLFIYESVSRNCLAYFGSNSNMLGALMRLGWYEFEKSAVHFAGSLFELLVYVAYLYGHDDVIAQLLTALLGSYEVDNRYLELFDED